MLLAQRNDLEVLAHMMRIVPEYQPSGKWNSVLTTGETKVRAAVVLRVRSNVQSLSNKTTERFCSREEGQGGKRRVDPLRLHAEAQFSNFETIQEGDEAEFYKTITAEDVEDFARLSGDRNPLHMDEQFAGRTRFQRRVVHGMLLASYVSTLVGMHCPGPGALWSQQNFRWTAPAFINDRVHFRLRVTHKSTGARALMIKVTESTKMGR